MALRPRRPSTQLGRGLEIGLQFGLSVLIGVAIGHYLDQWLDTGPWLLLLFIAIGFTAGIRNLMRLAPPPPAPSDPSVSNKDSGS